MPSSIFIHPQIKTTSSTRSGEMTYGLISVIFMILTCTGISVIVADASSNPEAASIQPKVVCRNPNKGDQDDLAFWIDEEHPERSVVLASDKKAC